jgi:hypothetical protein
LQAILKASKDNNTGHFDAFSILSMQCPADQLIALLTEINNRNYNES